MFDKILTAGYFHCNIRFQLVVGEFLKYKFKNNLVVKSGRHTYLLKWALGLLSFDLQFDCAQNSNPWYVSIGFEGQF